MICRPVSQAGLRVTPTDLSEYRRMHSFRAPCCLCACTGDTDANAYCESAIYIAIRGPYSGEYVAGCASDACSYLSKLVLPSSTCHSSNSSCLQSWHRAYVYEKRLACAKISSPRCDFSSSHAGRLPEDTNCCHLQLPTIRLHHLLPTCHGLAVCLAHRGSESHGAYLVTHR